MTPIATEAPPSDRVAELVARAKDIISGRVPPPDIEIPESVRRFYAELYADKVPPPLPSIVREFSERNALELKYRPGPVLVFLRPDGFWSLLAEDFEAATAIFQELINEEQSKVMLVHTLIHYKPWGIWGYALDSTSTPEGGE